MHKVSVITPCYNQAEYLSECLDSVLLQTYDYWECIIVNDGSSDNTEEVALEYCIKDARFKYLHKENGGLSCARNAGIEHSTGLYILPLDADDKIGPNYLEHGVVILDGEDNVKLVYGGAEFFGSEIGVWDLQEYSLNGLALRNLIYCSALFRRSDFNATCGYDPQFVEGWEDWDLWLSMLKTSGDVRKLPGTHFYYRKKLDSMIENLAKNEEASIRIRRTIYLKHFDLYSKLFDDPIQLLHIQKSFKDDLMRNDLFWQTKLKEVTSKIYRSTRYRLGDFILKPLKFLKWAK